MPGQYSHHCVLVLYVGQGPRGSNGTCTTVCRISVTPSATHNQIGPLWCLFLSGWACALSRPLWVSPANSPVRLGVSLAATTTPRVYSIRGLRLHFPTLEPSVAWSASLPHCSSWFIYVRMWAHRVCQLLPCGFCYLQPGLPRSTIRHLAISSSRCLLQVFSAPAANLHPSYQCG